MKRVAYIHAHPKAAETLRMLWPGFKKLGMPLTGVECVDGTTEWPEPVPVVKAGRDLLPWQDKWNLPLKLVETLEHFLTTDYEQIFVLEPDTLIVAPPPDYPLGFVAKRAGGVACRSKTGVNHFYHTPWIMDRDTAGKFAVVGRAIVKDGGRDYKHMWSPDFFLGAIVDRSEIPAQDSGTFSVNTIDNELYAGYAKDALAEGVWMLHGVKKKEHLHLVTGSYTYPF